MGKIIYFTGGAKSGKSSKAEKYILNGEYSHKIYVATAIPFDDEMKIRVKKHQKDRGNSWITVEGYKNLPEMLEKVNILKNAVILLDCLTNMATNIMFETEVGDFDNLSEDELNKIEKTVNCEVEALLEYVKNKNVDLVVVSNELGMGVVPPYSLGRHFRDICGRINQIVAGHSNEAYLVVSGIEIRIK